MSECTCNVTNNFEPWHPKSLIRCNHHEELPKKNIPLIGVNHKDQHLLQYRLNFHNNSEHTIYFSTGISCQETPSYCENKLESQLRLHENSDKIVTRLDNICC